MTRHAIDSFASLRTAVLGQESYSLYSLEAFERQSGKSLQSLPYSKRALLENLLRHEDDETVTRSDILALAGFGARGADEREVAFYPSRVLMPDSSGVPLLVDLASMRDRVAELGADPELVEPVIPVDIVVDHSITTDHSGSVDALMRNMALEYERNAERYRVLKWAQGAFKGLRVVPPGNGILHQVNLEFLAQVITAGVHWGTRFAYPDSLVGTDSHTPMINALGTLGWGVGGIEAGSAMLGEPISMLVPRVVGCRLNGTMRAGTTATDVVLSLTDALRRHGVVGKFVEFCGPGIGALSLPDRATISNMAPEYGATMGYFPIDKQSIDYLRITGRLPDHIARVEAYCRLQRLWLSGPEPAYDETLEFELGRVGSTLSGPRRPEQRVDLDRVASSFRETFQVDAAKAAKPAEAEKLRDGDVVIAAITSCTNTSNPFVMVAAGLLARNALRAGLKSKPWVKTSLAPGSRRVAEYLHEAGLDAALDQLGFQTVGYGCMTCMGGAGDLLPGLAAQIQQQGLNGVAVLSGNRNFDARIHPLVRANYLASPPLVVAYALAGSMLIDLTTEPLGIGHDGMPVFLQDIWPQDAQVHEVVNAVVKPALFLNGYRHVFEGDAMWQALTSAASPTFCWDPGSTYIRRSPFADAMGKRVDNSISLAGARILAMLGDDVTTDHISPVGATAQDSAVGQYLVAHGVHPRDFNLLLTRRANPDVVARTAFANVRLRNELVPEIEGGMTRHLPGNEVMNIHAAAQRYRDQGIGLVVVAGMNYGAGSSRDTAAKGTALLGVCAVIAEGFERIHRSNLVGVGVFPLQFPAGTTRKTLGLTGTEHVDLSIGEGARRPGMPVHCRFTGEGGSVRDVVLTLRVDTQREMRWIDSNGILAFVGNELLQANGAASVLLPGLGD